MLMDGRFMGYEACGQTQCQDLLPYDAFIADMIEMA